MFRKLIVLFVLLLEGAVYGQSPPTIVVQKEKEHINIGQLVEVLKDTSGKLSYTDVSSTPYDSRFILSKQKTPNLGSTVLPVWCRFTIRNLTHQELVLAIDNSQIESLELYLQNSNRAAYWRPEFF